MNTTDARHRVALSFGAVLVLGATSFVRSEPAQAETTNFPFEITPYIGYQSGEELSIEDSQEEGHIPAHVSYALALNMRADNEGQYQFFFSHQPTHVDANSELPSGADIDIDYLHFGGTLRLDPESVLQPYIVGTLGATLLSPDIPTAHTSQVFSIGFAAGFRIPVRPQFDIVMEARGFVSFLPAGGSLFCSSGQTGAACKVQSTGSTFTQYALMVGAAFKF